MKRDDNTISALTIMQPFAHLICLPQSHPEMKRVENRGWPTRHRGPLAIHAGVSRSWLDRDSGRPGYDLSGFRISDMHFGAVVAIADLVDCVEVESWIVAGRGRFSKPKKPIPAELEWIRKHRHCEGPWAWVLQNVRVLAKPITKMGAQGLWNFTLPNNLEFLTTGAMPPPTTVSIPPEQPSLFT